MTMLAPRLLLARPSMFRLRNSGAVGDSSSSMLSEEKERLLFAPPATCAAIPRRDKSTAAVAPAVFKKSLRFNIPLGPLWFIATRRLAPKCADSPFRRARSQNAQLRESQSIVSARTGRRPVTVSG
ncbi:hypothetical protein SBA5_530010 [Candidatus Sulfotelmatomonas gaucii]|uniref:Uncharacterized protein n=1 Tax=Candidatus Sulfuritelmatomonas gaucii TaxID=2043161 RepID=A0A2N9LSM6_9BACT|nr:hypothetical protein SBA5_530010 [Candidatus Sulfotelmatomonas gaucii]